MLLQILGALDILSSIVLFIKFENLLAHILIFLLFLKGISSFVNIYPPFMYSFITPYCAIIDILTAILLLIAFGFAGGISNLVFLYYLFKGLWSLVFGVIFN